MTLFVIGTSDSGNYIYQYVLGAYNMGMLYLKAFAWVLKAFAAWSSGFGKIKVEVLIVIRADEHAPIGNSIDLEGFECRQQTGHAHVEIRGRLRDCFFASLFKEVKEHRVGPLCE
jgi:hypothetical protein